MNIYLYSAGAVLPATSPDEQGRHLATEPDYTGIIAPMQLRRMTKGLRIGIAAAKMALENAGINIPDAICIGTAMGMLADTEVFLSKMVTQEETLLTPTAFIQSTHNTVSGAIALMLGCTGHNITYVQRGLSFEHALTGAALYLAEHPGKTVLCGGIDEITASSHALLKAGGAYPEEGGEGAAFFVLGDEPREGAWQLVSLLSGKAATLPEMLQRLPNTSSPDTILSGLHDSAILEQHYPDAAIQSYTNETGAFATVSGIALSRLFAAETAASTVLLAHQYLGDVSLLVLHRA